MSENQHWIEKLNLLKMWAAKAGCHYTQQKAYSLWKDLKPFLSEHEEFDLHDGWSHYQIRLGRMYIDRVVSRIVKCWDNKEDYVSPFKR